MDHNKHPGEEEAGLEAKPPASCYASPARRGFSARLGTDELEQLLRVAKHIISSVTVIRLR